ncbi:MAG: hypothetical protein ACD_10C00744G0001 [uncultured bacterium]|nr:MAG: hypothetical protein ACD_10C00744G0001 [uncultured bacterium]
MAMGKPIAAEVPMACWTRTLHQVRKGTVSAPPPIATSDDMMPMTTPAPATPSGAGSSRDAFGFRLSAICKATAQTKKVKKTARGRAGTLAANSVPIAVPNKIPGVMWRKTFHSTAPCLWCVRRLAMAVKMMVAIEVPSAICKVSATGK